MDTLSSAQPQEKTVVKPRGRPFPPGVSGCPGGAFGLTPELRVLRAAAQAYSLDALRELRDIAIDQRHSPAMRLRAANLLVKAAR